MTLSKITGSPVKPLLIRNVPVEVIRALKIQAAKNDMSLQTLVLAVLCEATMTAEKGE